MKFKQYISSKGPILALVIALVYGIVVFAIYFSGYHAMPNNVDKLTVTIVNQDKSSQQLSQQLKKALPYDHVKTTTDLSKAKKQLNRRATYLIINIPKAFSKSVSANKQPNLNFYVNESNQTSVVSAMKSTAASVGSSVNQKLVIKKGTLMIAKPQLEQLSQQLKQEQVAAQAKIAQEKQTIAAASASQQAQLTAKLASQVKASQAAGKTKATAKKNQIISQAKKQATPLANNVKVKIHRQNKVKTGLNYSLSPFIANLSIYLGAMLGTLVLYGTYAKFAKTIGRFKSFANLEMTMLLISVIASALVTWAMTAMMGLGGSHYFNLWITHSLMIFAAYNFNSMLILLMGQMGTAINVFFTMFQVVAGAGMIPVVAMNGLFKSIHGLMPMYYGVAADFNAMYGGTGTAAIWNGLIILIVTTLIINLVIVYVRKHQPMLDFSQLS